LISHSIVPYTRKKLGICDESKKKRSTIERREEIPRRAIEEGRITMCLGNRPCSSNSMNTFCEEKSATTIEEIFLCYG
jgi:hypothetical protein